MPIPPLPEQQAIAHTLGTLDDKIDLNRRMNKTLEAMARALFKSWFVDFDPVRAKAEGRDTTYPRHVADVFPSALVPSEFGEIPLGWRWGRLDEIATVTMGLSPPGESYNFAGIGMPLVNGPVEFGEYFPVQTKWTASVTKLAQEGDIILCVRGSTTGRRVISDGQYCIGRGVCSIRSSTSSQAFVQQTINSGIDRLLMRTTGSVFPSVSGPELKQLRVMHPSDSAVMEFERFASPVVMRIQRNERESQALATLRDYLLPRMMSGELNGSRSVTRISRDGTTARAAQTSSLQPEY